MSFSILVAFLAIVSASYLHPNRFAFGGSYYSNPGTVLIFSHLKLILITNDVGTLNNFVNNWDPSMPFSLNVILKLLGFSLSFVCFLRIDVLFVVYEWKLNCRRLLSYFIYFDAACPSALGKPFIPWWGPEGLNVFRFENVNVTSVGGKFARFSIVYLSI
jgi:hypothetical protein